MGLFENLFKSSSDGDRYNYRFDDEKRRRSSAGHEDEEPGYPVHREHGWYLPNDD